MVLQMTDVDCAAACLAMILRSFGRRVSLGECRRRLAIGRDGTSAYDLVQAAKSYGLEVEHYLLSADRLDGLEGPVVLGWRSNHFVVLERVRRARGRSVTIVDPAVGRRRVAPSDLRASFSGLVLGFRRCREWSRGETGGRHPWWSVIDHLLTAEAWRSLAVQVLAASLAIQLIGLAVPLLTRTVVDQLVERPVEDLLGPLFLGVAAWLVAQALFDFVRGSALALLRTRLDAHLMTALFGHLLSLPLAFFQLRGTGDLSLRQGSTASVREILSDRSLAAILDGIAVVVYAGVLLAVEPWFAALALAAGGLQCAVVFGTTVKVHRIAERELATRADAQDFLGRRPVGDDHPQGRRWRVPCPRAVVGLAASESRQFPPPQPLGCGDRCRAARGPDARAPGAAVDRCSARDPGRDAAWERCWLYLRSPRCFSPRW